MKRCKHQAWGWYQLGDALVRRCLSCPEWLPLGPAADDLPESQDAVAIEIRAAELAAMPPVSIEQWPAGLTSSEASGWLLCAHGGDPIFSTGPALAGYLARIIYEHGEEEA